MNVEDLLKQRSISHGNYPATCEFVQGLKATLGSSPNWGFLTSFQKQSLEMIALKISRILYGDHTNVDSWVDIAGYAQLAADALRSEDVCVVPRTYCIISIGRNETKSE